MREPTLPAHPWRRRLGQIGVILGVLLLLYLAYTGWQTYRHASALRRHLAALRALAPAKLDTLGAQLTQIQGDVAALRRDLAVPLALAPHLGWVPRVGPTIQAAPALVSAGEALLSAGVLTWGVVEEPACAVMADPTTLAQAMPRLAAQITERQSELARAADLADQACARLAAIDAGRLIPRLKEPVAQLQELLPLLRASFDGLPLLPALLGSEGERTYLVLAQNNDELRPTGGFISSIGVLGLKGGVPNELAFKDSYNVENWKQPHGDPPEPLRRYMGLDLWVTRDGNWWPDFPTSAQAVADLYQLNRERRVDGVLAIDTVGAARLLDVLAPLKLSGGQRLERGQVLDGLRQSWSLPPGSLVTEGVVITATRPFTAVEIALQCNKREGTVWFDTVRLEGLASAGQNWVQNPSLEEDTDSDRIPDDWQARGFTAEDGLVTDQAHSGGRSLRVVGSLEATKQLVQRIPLEGQAGTAFRIAAESRADSVAVKGGTYALTVTFLSSEGKPQVVNAGFPTLTHEWATAGTDKVLGAWWSHRKDFMNLAMQAGLGKIASQGAKAPWPELLGVFRQLLDQRHIQFYATDTNVQSFLADYGWTGALTQTDGDYLLVADSNLGYNKVSANVRQSVEYQVSIDATRRVRSRLVLRYTNLSTTSVEVCDKYKQYLPTYETLTQGCYWDYVRVYVPQGAELLSAQGGDEPAQVLDELDRTVLATYLILPPGQERQLEFEYVLPADVLSRDGIYRLDVQKQAGTDAIPMMLTLTAPAGSEVLRGNLGATQEGTGQTIWKTDLLYDRHLELRVAS